MSARKSEKKEGKDQPRELITVAQFIPFDSVGDFDWFWETVICIMRRLIRSRQRQASDQKVIIVPHDPTRVGFGYS